VGVRKNDSDPYLESELATGRARVTSNLGAFVNHCCNGKALSITYSECSFVALGIQHAMRVRHIMSSVTCLAVQYFLHITSHAARFSAGGGGTIEHKILVLIFCTPLSETFPILIIIQRYVTINVQIF